MNHILADNEYVKDTIEVPIDKLDNIVSKKVPSLIKIDVEGFETEVINGGENTILNNTLKAIIIELNGTGKRYGFDDEQIDKKLRKHGFLPYLYKPFERKLEKLSTFGKNNTIYIRDFNNIRERVNTAKKIKIFDKEY